MRNVFVLTIPLGLPHEKRFRIDLKILFLSSNFPIYYKIISVIIPKTPEGALGSTYANKQDNTPLYSV